MSPAKRPTVRVDIGRYSATITGPVRHTVPAVRAACGTSWSLDYDNRARCLRVPLSRVGDVIAALEAARVDVAIRGDAQPQLPIARHPEGATA